MTSIVYGSWAELNPATAAELDIEEGDIVTVTTPAGSVSVPVYIYPAIRPGVIGMPIGQGHTAYGRFAENRGANPVQIVELLLDDASGDLAWAATRAKLGKTGDRVRLVKSGGEGRTLGRQILGPSNGHS